MNKIIKHIVILVIIIASIIVGVPIASAQDGSDWTPQQRIPGYENDTGTPILIADRDRTVHAFSSQWLYSEEFPTARAIVYNKWILDQGWTTPIDILLSPFKNDARLLDAYLDQSGMAHVIFWGGDNTEAHIYYAQAPLQDAGRATAWTEPIVVGEAAGDPGVGAVTGDDQGKLVIIYSGRKQGNGLYTIYSEDGGETWTDPEPSFLTFSEEFPVILALAPGESGAIHAVWDVRDVGGNGRQINYASLDLQQRQWSDLVVLSEVETGYGVLIPTVVEHDGEILVAYSGVLIRRSNDGGKTWTEPVSPFPHVGVNGVMSFVTDSNQTLHLLWAQRITGSPDIHGAWHSTWQDGRWSVPEAIVSGPTVTDIAGDKAFDPYDVHTVVSQGNLLLVTWRSDPGLKGNGVWYSYKELDAPELPLEMAQMVLPTPTSNPDPTMVPSNLQTASSPGSAFSGSVPDVPGSSFLNNNPINIVLVGLIPVLLLISVVSVVKFFGYRSRS